MIIGSKVMPTFVKIEFIFFVTLTLNIFLPNLYVTVLLPRWNTCKKMETIFLVSSILLLYECWCHCQKMPYPLSWAKLLPWKHVSHQQFNSDCLDICRQHSRVVHTYVYTISAKSDKNWQFWKIDLDLKNFDLQRLERSSSECQIWLV